MLTDLAHHGDADLMPGLVDLAVNVRPGGTPAWLTDRLRAVDLSSYPDQVAAIAAVAQRHRRAPDEVLLTAGAAEAFVLLARALRPRHAVIVHPQFTEPEAALLAAGHQVDRVVLHFPYRFEAESIPDDADLVIIGNPTNPTSVLHPAEVIRSLVRPGRLVVVDEAFADCVPGETESLAGSAGLDGLVVIRSLTKSWALAGLRVGYLLAAPGTIRLLRQAQPLWPVSSPGLVACIATAEPAAQQEIRVWSEQLTSQRDQLLAGLIRLPLVHLTPDPSASFVLLDTGRADARIQLHRKGFAVRRGETFPGLGASWIRIAVREPAVMQPFVHALTEVLADG